VLGPLRQVHDQVSSLLGDPGPDRVNRDTHDVDGPGDVLDEEQHTDPFEKHCVDMEQVTGEDPLGLGLQELAPARSRPSGCGIQSGTFEDVPHRAGRNPDTDAGELAADPLIAPSRVLSSQLQHRFPNVPPGGGAAWTFPSVGPSAGDQIPVPAQERRRRHEEHLPRRPRQQPRQRGQQGTVCIIEIGTVPDGVGRRPDAGARGSPVPYSGHHASAGARVGGRNRG
jgi:hypothetical protein